MRAAIAVPPVRDFYHTRHRFAGLGAEIVATILESNGWEVRTYNFPLGSGKGRPEPLPEELGHLRPFIIPDEFGPLSFFTQFRQFGSSFADCAESILQWNPDAVFISCFAFCYAEETISLARAVKRLRPDLPIIAGGSGVTVLPEYFTRSPYIDTVLTGEAELCIPDYLSGISTEHSCPRFTESSEIEPAAGITNITKECLQVSISVTRGCPKQCRFCSNRLTHGTAFRAAPIGKVIEKLKRLPASHELSLNFEDDNILADPEYFTALVQAVHTLRPGHVRIYAENGIDYMMLDEKMIDTLLNSGFMQFNLSLGTASTRIRDIENRNGDPEKLQRIIAYLDERQIPSVTYFICGLQDDSIETVCGNLFFLTSLRTRTGISLFYPVPGLPGFEDPAPFLSVSSRRAAGSSAWPWTGSMSTASLVTAFRLARFSNLLKDTAHRKKPVTEHETQLIRTILETGELHTLRKNGKKPEIIPVPDQDKKMSEWYCSKISTLDTLFSHA